MLTDEEGEPFMGIGVVWLLNGIDKSHSISQAAREMTLSYPKALKMIQSLEDTLQAPMVTRFKGGHQRGGAELTQEGRDFLRRYMATLKDIQKFARESFKANFEGFLCGASGTDAEAAIWTEDSAEKSQGKQELHSGVSPKG